MELKQKIRCAIEYREGVTLYGLSLLMILAGASKYFITASWLGFEPQFLVSFLPLTAVQLLLLGGAVEFSLGLWLSTRIRTDLASLATFLWLLFVTLQVISLEAWTIAIRDLGILVLAYSVAADHLLESL